MTAIACFVLATVSAMFLYFSLTELFEKKLVRLMSCGFLFILAAAELVLSIFFGDSFFLLMAILSLTSMVILFKVCFNSVPSDSKRDGDKQKGDVE